jgi:hypothetical protein
MKKGKSGRIASFLKKIIRQSPFEIVMRLASGSSKFNRTYINMQQRAGSIAAKKKPNLRRPS